MMGLKNKLPYFLYLTLSFTLVSFNDTLNFFFDWITEKNATILPKIRIVKKSEIIIFYF